MSFREGRSKDNKQRLMSYLNSFKFHPDVKEHATIARSFKVASYKPIFRQDAIRRLINATYSEPTTSAAVEKMTGIKQKYLCELKRQLEKKDLIRVVFLGKCPTTGSSEVQFLSSDVGPKSNNKSRPRKTLTDNIGALKEDGLINGAKIRHTVDDGKQYMTEVFNLNEVIAIGFRLRSDMAIHLQRYAANLMVERISAMAQEKRMLELELSYAWNRSDTKDLYR